jgi:Ethanolamine utilization protein EutJ (predicted chaperonin)
VADSIVLTGGEYITDKTGVAWYDIIAGGRIRIQVLEQAGGDVVEVLDEICPSGKVWKVRMSVCMTITEE